MPVTVIPRARTVPVKGEPGCAVAQGLGLPSDFRTHLVGVRNQVAIMGAGRGIF